MILVMFVVGAFLFGVVLGLVIGGVRDFLKFYLPKCYTCGKREAGMQIVNHKYPFQFMCADCWKEGQEYIDKCYKGEGVNI